MVHVPGDVFFCCLTLEIRQRIAYIKVAKGKERKTNNTHKAIDLHVYACK